MTGTVRPAAQGPLEIQTLPAMTAMRQSCFCSIPCKLSESSCMELKGHFFSWNACEASRQDQVLSTGVCRHWKSLSIMQKHGCGFKPICSGFCSSSSAPASEQKPFKAAKNLQECATCWQPGVTWCLGLILQGWYQYDGHDHIGLMRDRSLLTRGLLWWNACAL